MGRPSMFLNCLALSFLAASAAYALDRPDKTFQVFQFPRDKMPRIDGNADDWAMVPESYVVGTTELRETDGKHTGHNPQTLDIRVRVGWVAGLNRLYFLYEAYDNYWDFSRPGLTNDTFEVVVDGDVSGGPLVDSGHPDIFKPELVGERRATHDARISVEEAHWWNHGVHAQNYHIFTPAREKDWTMVWGSSTWIKEFPYANSATSYSFQPGEAGKLVLEFWITPYDYAGPEGPSRAVESVLSENKIIGLGWIVIDYDNVNSNAKDGFWCLSSHRNMWGETTALPAFRLMPLESNLRKPLEANWSFLVTDMARRSVQFTDKSVGEVQRWKWDFGDGQSSTEQHPIHAYAKPGNYVVILEVEGPAGVSKRSKVWDVQLQK